LRILNGLLLAWAVLPLFCQSPSKLPEDFQTGILYGGNHAYALTAPKGWVLDEHAGAANGIHAVFYERGGSISSPRHAYTLFFPPHPKGAEGRAEEDLIEFKTNNPGVSIQLHPDMATRTGLKAVIRSTRGDSKGNSEWLAYIEAPTGTIFICMVAKKATDHPKVRQPFIDLVESCAWFADKVKIQGVN